MKAELLNAYEATQRRDDDSHPHWLGFPISDEGVTASGKKFSDFEHGSLVSYIPNPPYPNDPTRRNVVQFEDLVFHLDRVEGFTCDGVVCAAGDTDLYYQLQIATPAGVIFNQTRDPDEWSDVPNWNLSLAGTAHSSLSWYVQLDMWDVDAGDPNYLGRRSSSYNVDNLWGALDQPQQACDGFDPGPEPGAEDQTCYCPPDVEALDSDFCEGDRTVDGDASQAWYSMRHDLPLTGSYLADYNWNFTNSWSDAAGNPRFAEEMGTENRFASTFQDVGQSWLPPGEWLKAPLQAVFFELVYKGFLNPVKKGACFGMNLEATYVKNDDSLFSKPLSLAGTGPTQEQALSAIDIKHGYQIGLDPLLYELAVLVAPGSTTSLVNDLLSYTYWAAGADPQISISDPDFLGYAHTVRPYRWESFTDEVLTNCPQVQGVCTVVHVADPNRPLASGQVCPSVEACKADPSACPEACKVTLEFGLADFAYTDDGGEKHAGPGGLGARAIVLPGFLYDHPQYTPFAGPLALIEHVFTLIVGGYAQAHEMNDDQGRRLFKAGLTGAPTRWDHLEDPGPTRMRMIPVPMTNGTDTPSAVQFYFGQGEGGTHTYNIAPDPSRPAGDPYEVAFSSGKLGVLLTIPGTPGQLEQLQAQNINSAAPGFSIGLPAGAQPKAVKAVVSGVNKYRSIELANMALVGAQTFTMALEKGGYVLVYNNDGPPTSAEVTVTGGVNVPGFMLGTVQLMSGEGRIDFRDPRTTLTVSGEVPGNDTWLLAPVTVALEADDFSGTGIAAIEWSLDGLNFIQYTGPFAYAEEGVTTLHYRARDNQFNQEALKTHAFKIDTRQPTATGTVATSSGVVLTYAVSDPIPGSGPLGLFATVQGSAGPITLFSAGATGAVPLPTQCSAVEFWGEDVAGNEQSPHVVVADSVAPVFTFVPADMQTSQCTSLNIGLATATDDCSAVTVTNNAPAKFPLGVTVVTWTARDVTGNMKTATQKVTATLGDDPSCCPSGTKILLGNNNANTLTGTTTGSDCILLRGGNDTVNSFGGNDFVSGGAGNDTITTGNGNDYVNGGAGVDTCYALGGTNTVLGCEVSP